MPTRLPSLLRPPLAFAHRGARAHAPENTLEAFELAHRLGATGLETDAWVTADGHAVLVHDGTVGPLLRRRKISTLTRDDLPPTIPAAAELVPFLDDGLPVSIDVKDPEAAGPLLDALGAGDPTRLARVWLCHDDHDRLTSWRDQAPAVRLVDSTRLKRLGQGPERHAARLRERGIDAVNLHHSDWSGGLVALFHRFDVLAWGWDAQQPRVLDGLFDMGIDAVFSDHVDRMVEALERAVAP